MLQPGGSWPQCYDSLTLFSPARYCALPGLPFPGDERRYPHRDEAASYLRRHADHFELPVRTGSRVAAVRMQPDGSLVELSGGKALTAPAVIAATGWLARVARERLATRSPLTIRRQRPLSVDLHHWLHDGRIDRLPLGRRAAAFVGVLDDGQYTAALAAGHPEQRDMYTTLTADGVRWPGGTHERVHTVVLGTGHRPALDILPPEASEPDDWPAQRRGISTTVPGLGYVGLPGQTGVASAVLRGVGPDAAHVVRQLQRQLSTAGPRRATVPVGGGHG